MLGRLDDISCFKENINLSISKENSFGRKLFSKLIPLLVKCGLVINGSGLITKEKQHKKELGGHLKKRLIFLDQVRKR